MSLGMWASEVRSMHNFYCAQMLRDRNREALAGQPRIPSKLATWDGERDFIEWTEIQRNEFDNANELIALLETGGLPYLGHAARPEDEDTFLLGPDVVDALNRKTRIMRAHWLDAQKYLASPMK